VSSPRRFDIIRNGSATADRRPFLIVLQSDDLGSMETRVVAPLARIPPFRPIRILQPVIEIVGADHALVANEMAAVPRKMPGPIVSSGRHCRYEILRAIDLIFTGV